MTAMIVALTIPKSLSAGILKVQGFPLISPLDVFETKKFNYLMLSYLIYFNIYSLSICLVSKIIGRKMFVPLLHSDRSVL